MLQREQMHEDSTKCCAFLRVVQVTRPILATMWSSTLWVRQERPMKWFQMGKKHASCIRACDKQRSNDSARQHKFAYGQVRWLPPNRPIGRPRWHRSECSPHPSWWQLWLIVYALIVIDFSAFPKLPSDQDMGKVLQSRWSKSVNVLSFSALGLEGYWLIWGDQCPTRTNKWDLAANGVSAPTELFAFLKISPSRQVLSLSLFLSLISNL